MDNNTRKQQLLTHEKNTAASLIELGRYLFYENHLSFNQTKSCASCHNQAFAFSDGYRRSTTATGETVLHNAPSLINASQQLYLSWANPAITNLYQQNERPLFSEHPVEMGVKGNEEKIMSLLKTTSPYPALLRAAFPFDSNYTFTHIRKALTVFTATLVSRQSPYDKYVNGDTTQMTQNAKKGMQLFFSNNLQCSSCHPPPDFTLNSIYNKKNSSAIFINNGLLPFKKNIEKIPEYNLGLYKYTFKPQDIGKFKIPSLRNVTLTSPYTHNGSIASLYEIVDHYRTGGKAHPNKDSRIKGFSITEQEKLQLIAFLHTLTDSTVLTNPAFANPHVY
jgi:cytochrome c peroxidase